MITPMEKITILIFHRAKNDFLNSLQDMGVVHISQDIKKGMTEELKAMKGSVDKADIFLKAAKKVILKEKNSLSSSGNTAEGILSDYESLIHEINNSRDELSKADRQIRNLVPWGNFSIESMRNIKSSGIRLRFFISTLKNFSTCGLNDNICAFEISRDKTYVYFVVFEKEERVKLSCDEFFPPECDLKTLQSKAETINMSLTDQGNKLEALFAQADIVENYRKNLESRMNYAMVSTNLDTAVEDNVYIIKGWLPKEIKNNAKKMLDDMDVYSYFTKPGVYDNVPILLKNNRFARLFEPITKMFSLPNYAELDLTAFFAPFFTLFFGFCLGDAGYGLMILLLCAIFRRKVSEDKRPFITLGAIFGASTFLFGLISGNLFGIELIKVDFMKNFVLLNQDQLFYLSLKIGVVQIFFGMFLKAFNKARQFGFMASISTWGWVIMLTGVLPLVLAFLAETQLPKWGIYTSLTGFILIMLFNDLKANIFIRMGKGLWELYGGLTGFLGDVLSYVRLFALGISGAILGLVVNEIGMQFRAIPFIGYFITFAFLIIGHTANFLLSGLSSFVHPLRLTFVEFYKNGGFEGGGKAYTPFRKIK